MRVVVVLQKYPILLPRWGDDFLQKSEDNRLELDVLQRLSLCRSVADS
jgi:hypothetical protein